MDKFMYPKILTGLLLMGVSMACGIPFIQIVRPETETPVPTASSTETETPLPTAISMDTATSEPTEIVTPATATPKFAPFCQPSSASVLTPTPSPCQIPIAEQSSLFCSNKVPYNLILINEGSSYEVLNEDIECSDAGMRDGKQMLTCTGPMALPFEIKVCDPACAIPTFQAGTTHCPQNFTFNELLNCCEQEPQPIAQDCVVLSLQTKSCMINCAGFTDAETCDENARACKWNTADNVCQLKK